MIFYKYVITRNFRELKFVAIIRHYVKLPLTKKARMFIIHKCIAFMSSLLKNKKVANNFPTLAAAQKLTFLVFIKLCYSIIIRYYFFLNITAVALEKQFSPHSLYFRLFDVNKMYGRPFLVKYYLK
jgi:hypothetical protein